jgi:alkylhydroperoxidase family enzyme
MARVRQVDPDEASPEQRSLFDLDVALFGEPLSATRVYALRPDIFRHVHALHASLADGTRLPEDLVARARRRVAEVHGSPF